MGNLVFCEWITLKTGESPWDGCHLKLPIASKLKQIIDDKGMEDIAATYVTLKKEQADDHRLGQGKHDPVKGLELGAAVHHGAFFQGRRQFGEKAA